MTFSQVGERASSKSAMKTLAPELSALIIILRSTGPVISTRRSCRSGGVGATCQSASRTAAVSARKSGLAPESRARLALGAALEQLPPRGVEAAVERRDERGRGRGEHVGEVRHGRARPR